MTETEHLNLAAVAQTLRAAFPGYDSMLALSLLRLLAEGQPVDAAALARVSARTEAEVRAQVQAWPNVERDEPGRVVGFSGLTLRPTAHSFRVGEQKLHAWCAWDTLFLPALLDETAQIRSA